MEFKPCHEILSSDPSSYEEASPSSATSTSTSCSLEDKNVHRPIDWPYTSFSSASKAEMSRYADQSQERLESQVGIVPSQSSLGFLPCSNGNLMSSSDKLAVHNYQCVATLRCHDIGHVSALALAGDHLYYSASNSRNIRVCMQPTLSEYCNFGSGTGAVKALAVAGERIFSAHQFDHKIRVWERSNQDPAKHRLVATVPTVQNYMLTFILPKNYVQIRRHHKRLWIEHVDTISVLAWGRNGLLYSGSWDRTVKVWRSSDFRCLESFRAHDDAINALVVSDDGFVYTGSADAKISVWGKQLGKKKHSLVTTKEGHKCAVNALALSADGSVLYSGSGDSAMIVWERDDRAQNIAMTGTLRGHRQAILCLACVENTLCVSGSADKTIRVWKREVGMRMMHSCVAVLRGHTGPVKCLSARMDELMKCVVIYSGSLDQHIKVWLVYHENFFMTDFDQEQPHQIPNNIITSNYLM